MDHRAKIGPKRAILGIWGPNSRGPHQKWFKTKTNPFFLVFGLNPRLSLAKIKGLDWPKRAVLVFGPKKTPGPLQKWFRAKITWKFCTFGQRKPARSGQYRPKAGQNWPKKGFNFGGVLGPKTPQNPSKSDSEQKKWTFCFFWGVGWLVWTLFSVSGYQWCLLIAFDSNPFPPQKNHDAHCSVYVNMWSHV